jgi:hypothetical protein
VNASPARICADMSEVAAIVVPDETLTLALPASTTLPDWIALGRSLAVRKRQTDWLIGDWIAFGREHFPEQLDLHLPEVADDPRNLRRIERTAKTFPPHLRNAALTFDHHAHVADMPVQEALPLLKQAERENLSAKALRHRAIERKMETGQILVRDEEDAYDRQITALTVEWNRSLQSVRDDFREMAEEANWGLIEL